MKRIIPIFLFCIFAAVNVMAQSGMTDEQIIEFCKQEKAAGAANGEILTKLMARGVTAARLQQLRRKLEREQETTEQPTATTDDVRMRSPNGVRNPNGVRSPNGVRNQNSMGGVNDMRNVNSMRTTIGQQQATMLPDNKNVMEGEEDVDFLLNDSILLNINEPYKVVGPKVFGHDIFNSSKLSFEPNMNIATPDDYRLGVGDAVVIDIFGASQKTIHGTISPEGTVTVDMLGPVYLSGLTVAQANARLRSELGQRYSSSRIQLTVGQTKTMMINIMGEVKAPGTYMLSAFASVFHALYISGGPNDIGTLRAVKVFRGGRLVSTIDVYDYILGGKLTGNIMLADNDVIVVDPYHSIVDIEGKVKRPMLYEMKADETVADLIRYAGGFAGDAYTDQVQLIRKTGVEYSIHSVGEFEMGSFNLHDQDHVRVDEVLPRFSNMVEIRGAVFRPGQYQLGGRVTTVRALVENAGGLREEAFTPHVVMHRRRADRTLEVVAIDLQGVMNGTAADVSLRKDDILFVPTRADMMMDRTISISGEVYNPGTYIYAEGETLEDFILQAGGLTDWASVAKVDILRRVIDPFATSGDSVIAQTFTFSLKEGFVIDGEQAFQLQPFDHVSVRRSPGSRQAQMVQVEGEVQFGGAYAINSIGMRLSDLVKVAGGITNKAYLRGARLERKILPEERVRMEEVLKHARLEAEERANEEQEDNNNNNNQTSHTQEMSRFNIGTHYYVGINLDEAMANPGSDADVQLREGDRLILPEYTPTVRINGEVMQTNSVAYIHGKKLDYYINKAGGYSLNAKKSRTYIFYMNGTLARAKKGKIEPGCEIVVPRKLHRKRSMAEVMSYATSATSLATMVASLANIIK